MSSAIQPFGRALSSSNRSSRPPAPFADIATESSRRSGSASPLQPNARFEGRHVAPAERIGSDSPLAPSPITTSGRRCSSLFSPLPGCERMASADLRLRRLREGPQPRVIGHFCRAMPVGVPTAPASVAGVVFSRVERWFGRQGEVPGQRPNQEVTHGNERGRYDGWRRTGCRW